MTWKLGGEVARGDELHRWYDAGVGRWLSQDPIGFAAGDANLYRYVGNGATNATDPDGLKIRIRPKTERDTEAANKFEQMAKDTFVNGNDKTKELFRQCQNLDITIFVTNGPIEDILFDSYDDQLVDFSDVDVIKQLDEEALPLDRFIVHLVAEQIARERDAIDNAKLDMRPIEWLGYGGHHLEAIDAENESIQIGNATVTIKALPSENRMKTDHNNGDHRPRLSSQTEYKADRDMDRHIKVLAICAIGFGIAVADGQQSRN